jgi:hypothetical protein
VKGISLHKVQHMLRLIGAKPKRVPSEAQLAVLVTARLVSSLFGDPTRAEMRPHAPESIGDGHTKRPRGILRCKTAVKLICQ